MFCHAIPNIILFIIIFIAKDVFTLAIDFQYNFEKQLNRFEKPNTVEQGKRHRINMNVFSGNDYGREDYVFEEPKTEFFKREDSNEDCEDQYNKNSYRHLDPDYDDQIYNYKIINIGTPNLPYATRQKFTRGSMPNGTLPKTALYPSVLTKALEISLNTSVPSNPKESLFSNVAQKMNTTTLDLAEKIAKSETSKNDEVAKMVQNYIRSDSVLQPNNFALSLIPTQNTTESSESNPRHEDSYIESEKGFDGITSSLAEILDRVLNKLDSINIATNNADEEHPEGTPCDVIGSWSSTTLGFCFDIQLLKDNMRNVSPAEINNKILSINVSECIPAKHHQFIDLDWKFTGSAIKLCGGPFYVYGQKKQEGVIAAFLGYCRTCGGIDTILGSWNFLSPSKDCHDISLANQVKPDILRRVRMEIKRRERFKELLYQSRHRNI